MSSDIRVISSMATRRLLAELAAAFASSSSQPVFVESVGGVDAAKRVAAGERFDAVVLASGAIDKLIAGGSVLPGSRVDVVRSSIAVAVRAGSAHVAIDSEDDVRRAVLAAQTIGYSTGPSGDHLLALFARWGIAEDVRGRLVQAPPGVGVAALVARGDAQLGFQQLSEFMNAPGIEVVGPLPESIQGVTIFSAGVAASTTQPAQVRELLAFLASPDVVNIKRQNGMEPA